MNKEEAIRLIKKLDIKPGQNVWDIEKALYDHLGFSNVDCSCGASKECIIFKNEPFVIKWCMYPHQDEAIKEVQIYERAVEAGVEKFFPPTMSLCCHNGLTFIVQAKVDCSVSNCDYQTMRRYAERYKTASPKIMAKIQKCMNKASDGKYARCLNTTWMMACLVLYGKRAVKDLCDFIIAERINDLHESNIGWKNGKPIILDFCGYR